jgi:hypothetical protein
MVSGQPRRTTHFYSLPPEDAIPAWKHLLESCSDLAIPERLPLPKAIFIAGYICHLHADEIWLYDIFLPFFGPGAGWCTQKKRSYLHNVLRSYLDNNVLEVLPGHAGHLLQKACPNNWLPFASDESLVQWRDLVAKQLRPGAQIQTLEVFANRHGLSTEEFYSILKSEERMDSEVFNHLSRRHVMQYRHKIVQANVQFLSQYLDFIS